MKTNTSLVRFSSPWLRELALLIAAFCAPFFVAIEAWSAAPDQYALIIGNSRYSQQPLKNPVNDAELMSRTLKKLGYNVTTASNLDRKGIFSAVSSFTASLPKGSIALIYYAGHGMQINGINYLLPVDIEQTSEIGTARRAYPVQSLLARLEAAPSVVNIVVLDACRNNPFQPPQRYRSFSQLGLAKISSPKGTIVAYSAAPGEQAPDGSRNNSFYTEALATEMSKSGLAVEEIFKRVADSVRKQTFDDQRPWFESSLVDDYYFLPPNGVRIVTRAKPTQLALAGKTQSRGVQIQSRTTGFEWYMQLSESEWSNFDWEVGQRVRGLTEDEIPLLEQRAKAGNVVAQTTLGIAYREGIRRITESGSNRTFRSGSSNSKSLFWLRKAAEAGFPMAQVELGEMYYQGQGVDRDLNESAHWLEMASRARYPRAKLDLAQVKVIGSGSPKDIQQMAVELLKNWEQVADAPKAYPDR